MRYEVDWKRVEKATRSFQVIPVSVAPNGATLEQTLDNIAPELYDYPPYGVDANDASMPGQ